ncbi:uncharacterized protein LOC108911126, partial [Anoplophora glabripennis]|uniref:uncharacterized protein LOC108911126 n=1 Tax=Anoplophora glabripennis TaxID=217634 RepID=UPI0008754B80
VSSRFRPTVAIEGIPVEQDDCCASEITVESTSQYIVPEESQMLKISKCKGEYLMAINDKCKDSEIINEKIINFSGLNALSLTTESDECDETLIFESNRYIKDKNIEVIINEEDKSLTSLNTTASNERDEILIVESNNYDITNNNNISNKCNIVDYSSSADSPVDDSDADPNYACSDKSESHKGTSADSISLSSEHNTETENEVVHKATRKRKRNYRNWKSTIRKTKRVSGECYVSKNKKVVRARKLGPPCHLNCKIKCQQNFCEDEREGILKQFWSVEADINQKRQFVASCVKVQNVKVRRVRTGERQGKRSQSLYYSFTKNNLFTPVCKTFFLHTLDISQSFVRTALAKRGDGGIVIEDKRGKKVPPNKTSEDIKNGIREHIMKFPVEESHYRRENSVKKYLGSHLNITKMYELYKEECQDRNIPNECIAKQWIYNEIFNTEFNYAFKSPYNDTCDECDYLQIQLRDSSTLNDRMFIQQKYDEHLKEATKRYELKRIDKQRSLENLKEKVIMVDLEKCLPTPVLTNAQNFYSLKLWTFNYTIHDASKKNVYCCMWDESIAGRGVNEMASCLLKWAQIAIGNDVEELTIWSDNCPSQNRNLAMIICYFYILKLFPQLKVINHKFLLRGHTHLEADSDHSMIERATKKQPQFQIMTPWDWQQVARIASRNKPFHVIGMETTDFKDFKSLYTASQSSYISRKKNIDGELFLISKAIHLKVNSESHGILYYKNNFDDDFSQLDLNRNRRNPTSQLENIPIIRNSSNPITTRKYQNLQNLLKWVPKVFHPFYQNLVHSEKTGEADDN